MTDYPYTPLYYATPVRVKYFDSDMLEYNMGICYRDELITNIGEIRLIEKIIKDAEKHGIHFDAAIIECVWRNIT